MPKYVYQTIKCPFCDEERKSTGLHRHIKTHGIEKWNEYCHSKEKPRYIEKDSIFYCVECDFSSSTRQSVTSHWWRNHTEKGQSHVSYGIGPKKARNRKTPAWNKGLNKNTDIRLQKMGLAISKTQQKQIANGTYMPRRMGEEARQRLSEKQALNNTGGKSKWYTVAGKRVQGTYELKFALQLEEEKILWDKVKTNNHIFRYNREEKIKSYAPDFYLPEFNLYVEIKGYWWGDDENKMRIIRDQHRDKNLVIVLGKENLDRICQNIKQNLPLEPVWSW